MVTNNNNMKCKQCGEMSMNIQTKDEDECGFYTEWCATCGYFLQDR